MSIHRLRNALLGGGLALLATLLGCPPAQPPTDNDNGDSNEPGGDVPFHQTVFTEFLPAGYEGPASCQVCHLNLAQDPAGTNGKKNLINAFLIGVPSNEGRCALFLAAARALNPACLRACPSIPQSLNP